MNRRRPPYLAIAIVGLGALGWRLFGYWAVSVEIDRAIGVGPAVAGSYAIRDAAPILPPYPTLTQTAPKFAARQYALYDVGSNTFVVEGDADTPVPLASTTKIMTTLLTIERGGLSDIVTVPQQAAYQIGSTAGLRPNERLTVRSLLYGALLNSGNDAAYSLAGYLGQKIGGDETADWDDQIQRTVQLMNARAKELKLDSLLYVEPSGLNSGNIGDARDLAKLAAYALEQDDFRAITSTPTYTITDVDGAISHELKNSNRLVGEWAYPGAIGVKTGFTPEAGHNLVAAVERDGHRLIAVVLNTYNNDVTASAKVARDMMDFAWRSIAWE